MSWRIKILDEVYDGLGNTFGDMAFLADIIT